jgi:hypothetical protein
MDGEIRVLELHPAELGTLLRGTLHIVSIDFIHPTRKEQHTQPFDHPANMSRRTLTYTRNTNHAVSLAAGQPVWFSALSYVWGAPIFNQTIAFEHGSINITSSLASALYRLRSTEHSVFLWIDQICINQPDLAEKVQQIPLMGMIYTHATNTIIWLGDDDGSDPSLAFDLMETIYARLQGTDAQVTPADFERLDFPPVSDRSWWALKYLLRRPWMGRLWTIQEAILSRHLFVKCGQAEAAWEDFAVWCFTLQDTGILRWLTANTVLDKQYIGVSTTALSSPQGATVINSIQVDRSQHLSFVSKELLLNILVSTRYAQATEPKDKIYGVLGIAESSIVPDYSPSTSARDVYHEACLTQIPLLMYELLSCVDHETPLPISWVPDWNSPRVTESLGRSTKAWTLYCAGSRPIARQQPKVILSDDKKEITLSAKVFDTILNIGHVSHDPILHIDEPQVGNRDLVYYAEIVRSASQTHAYPVPGTSTYDAFFQTLVAGRDGSGVVSPSQEHSEVFGLILDSATGQTLSLSGQTMSIRRQNGYFTLDSLRTRKPAKTLEDLRMALRVALKMRRFAVTSKGYFALVPRCAQIGDTIAVLHRACVPFVLRGKMGNERHNKFELLGEAYVHGIMKGEVMHMDDIELRDVTLV